MDLTSFFARLRRKAVLRKSLPAKHWAGWSKHHRLVRDFTGLCYEAKAGGVPEDRLLEILDEVYSDAG